MTVLSARFLPLLLLPVLAGCTLPAGEAPPVPPLAEQWRNPATATTELDRRWWQSFGSPELDTLIEQALSGAPDLRMAAERIAQAEARLAASGASLFPGFSISGDSSRGWSDPGINERSSLGFSLSYELDLWGKNRAGRLAADAGLRGSRYDFESARLSLTSSVATSWFQWLTNRERLRIGEANLRLAEDTLAIVEAKYRHGASALSEVHRQRSTVLSQQAGLAPLREQASQARSALAVLLGESPQQFELADAGLMQLQLPEVSAGLPAELLSRRPDLSSAEAALLAADADLAAARAALLPSISLTGSGGLASAALLSLADPGRSLSLGASLGQVLFDGGQRQAQVQLTEARRRELAEHYRQAALTALKEVEDALGNQALYREQESRQQAIVTEARETLRLTELRYREGAEELLALIDAQRTLFSAEDQLVSLRQSRLDAALGLFKALGGGWHAGAAGPSADSLRL
ncbi:efflux transporter outer membrane subunit [Oceanimonas baumannii]|uniref:efflux transporter outer membrane subunit n=1 Tax=Oceanimonas baumannii TaxID=129578 RepID=UPI001D1982CC|nr:efflux transporter outer membrane subunit [Oceanimonas baumannii]MCC4265825.1 efflux transporter outer membrane subunit [Oceanimonas baumannii]